MFLKIKISNASIPHDQTYMWQHDGLIFFHRRNERSGSFLIVCKSKKNSVSQKCHRNTNNDVSILQYISEALYGPIVSHFRTFVFLMLKAVGPGGMELKKKWGVLKSHAINSPLYLEHQPVWILRVKRGHMSKAYSHKVSHTWWTTAYGKSILP